VGNSHFVLVASGIAIVAKEVNAIGTAWQRLALLPAESQGAIRDAFRRYVDALLASRAELMTPSAALLEPPAVGRAVEDVWTRAVAACVIELEYPRLGLVRIDDMDRALAELRAAMR
jgi:hypothetical protein